MWGRYTQADPLGLAGGHDLYVYSLGNPVRYRDLMGLEVYPPDFIGPMRPHDVISRAGTPYPTQDAAALAALQEICATSIAENREYAAWIYMYHYQGMYYYTLPLRGEEHFSDPGMRPPGSSIAGDVHSHGAYSGPQFKQQGDDNFSLSDMYGADVNRVRRYIATPSGDLKSYDPDPEGNTIADVKRVKVIGRCQCK